MTPWETEIMSYRSSRASVSFPSLPVICQVPSSTMWVIALMKTCSSRACSSVVLGGGGGAGIVCGLGGGRTS